MLHAILWLYYMHLSRYSSSNSPELLDDMNILLDTEVLRV